VLEVDKLDSRESLFVQPSRDCSIASVQQGLPPLIPAMFSELYASRDCKNGAHARHHRIRNPQESARLPRNSQLSCRHQVVDLDHARVSRIEFCAHFDQPCLRSKRQALALLASLWPAVAAWPAVAVMPEVDMAPQRCKCAPFTSCTNIYATVFLDELRSGNCFASRLSR
jgi:hypothetical protein